MVSQIFARDVLIGIEVAVREGVHLAVLQCRFDLFLRRVPANVRHVGEDELLLRDRNINRAGSRYA